MTRRIVIETVPRHHMRPPYDQEECSGDWFYSGDYNETLNIRVAGLCDSVLDGRAFLFALHELVEAVLCRSAGVTQEQVDAFDEAFKGEGEPGDDPASPYRLQHRRAMLIEHIVADWLGILGYGRVE